CKILDGDFTCQVPSTTCQKDAKCGDASRLLDPPGKCPDSLNQPDDTVCFANCQVGKCATGTCAGQPVCSVDVVRKAGQGKLPKFAVKCAVDKSVTGTPDCTVDQVSTPLRSVLSPFGVSLINGTAITANGPDAETAKGTANCQPLGDEVRKQCA